MNNGAQVYESLRLKNDDGATAKPNNNWLLMTTGVETKLNTNRDLHNSATLSYQCKTRPLHLFRNLVMKRLVLICGTVYLLIVDFCLDTSFVLLDF